MAVDTGGEDRAPAAGGLLLAGAEDPRQWDPQVVLRGLVDLELDQATPVAVDVDVGVLEQVDDGAD